MRWLSSFLLLAVAGIASALSASGNRLLVVLEDAGEKDKYSQFWTELEGRGYDISFESPKKSDLSLFRLGERSFDHVVLLPPKSKAYGPALTPNILLDFLKAEGNILLALSANTPTPSGVVSLLLELDIHLPSDRNALVVDHFNYDGVSAAEKHDILLVSPPKAIRPDVKNYFAGSSPIAVPRAVPQTLCATSPLLAPVLRAPGTAYSYNPKDEAESVEDLFATGQQIALVSALQARNSARISVLGSNEMLQNEWFDAKVKLGGKDATTGNKLFSKQISEWTFKELGVLKVGKFQHHLDEGKSKSNESDYPISELNPAIYRIKNDVTFTIELSEWVDDHYEPFEPPAGDEVQVEFSMLSPFHRLPLTPVGKTATSTLYSTSFTLPDQHGIFNFRVNYKRPFLTNVDQKQQVTVRHFAHDEWPRSWRISGAWVWIGGIWVTVAGWLMFVALWLWSAPVKQASIKKQQ
ncbi:Dolichyl-diphosphooligosaccharide-protein glycosyltransferase 48kDa subunit [Trichodelitschia bisporula]|uniref:Dolichyl-diphosphooligosaccharide--protein glycosyltransferase subunit WBP1 n=1 Tax=Trichodelitschia bisporula TaxID=703511 RepID=A0A6G1HQ32_9PEZI|nr:Dolichyl-diphosphooligosaccharide-protein glycosyltransferase 48kDa subunit [Trichodelitschia bisporula]